MKQNTTPLGKIAPSERGQAIVLMVLLFIALLGIVALAVDGGCLYLERRSAQNAADNAAAGGAATIELSE
jgi:Flp pilus assembly protein TadG